MTRSIRIAPPNSYILVADVLRHDQLPDFTTQARIDGTKFCVAVGCEVDLDGETDITIGPAPDVDPGNRPVFDTILETPNRKVTVWTIEIEKLLEEKVATGRTRVRIWGNRPEFPDRVVIGLG